MIINKILLFCREERTLQEIAEHLGYSDKYRMKKVYIDPYLNELIKMSSSENKHSPKQKYIAIKSSKLMDLIEDEKIGN